LIFKAPYGGISKPPSQKVDSLLREYCQLYDVYSKQDNQRLSEILTPEAADPNAKKKSSIQKNRGGEDHG